MARRARARPRNRCVEQAPQEGGGRQARSQASSAMAIISSVRTRVDGWNLLPREVWNTSLKSFCAVAVFGRSHPHPTGVRQGKVEVLLAELDAEALLEGTLDDVLARDPRGSSDDAKLTIRALRTFAGSVSAFEG